MKKGIKIGLITLVIVLVAGFTFAKVKRISPLSWGHKEVNKPMFSDQAINGYDAVAYWTENKAVAGNENFTFSWKDAEWSFSSEENQKLFSENPEKYAPQYGGYCAFAVSKGFTANPDPEAFEIIDDKLYFFADEGVKADWKSDLNGNRQKSNTNWK
ncbi:MAG: hypothetical protein MI810_19185 [Flavobacteriales bacterium]|nr:hypothetical protein [Flavobacteriales bacterium]